ncbi:hypothetical protein [Thalassococcus arenae]|nr:hypothetical protein [Thalassococcus arenae]
MKRALVPPAFAETAQRLAMSPGILSNGHVFLTGVTASGPDGTMPADP